MPLKSGAKKQRLPIGKPLLVNVVLSCCFTFNQPKRSQQPSLLCKNRQIHSSDSPQVERLKPACLT